MPRSYTRRHSLFLRHAQPQTVHPPSPAEATALFPPYLPNNHFLSPPPSYRTFKSVDSETPAPLDHGGLSLAEALNVCEEPTFTFTFLHSSQKWLQIPLLGNKADARGKEKL
jgi:hypothetical protein